jgi:hypothetical protein
MDTRVQNNQAFSELWRLINQKTWFQAITKTTNKLGENVLTIKVNKLIDSKELKIIPREIYGIKVKIVYKKNNYLC